MLDVFFNVIAPVLVVAGLGGYVAGRFDVQVRGLSELSFYLLGPALVFDALSKIDVSGGEAVRIVGVVVLSYVAAMVLGYGAAAAFGFDRGMRSAMGLSVATGNNGNMGLPIVLLAFGDPALEIAVIAFVTLSVLTNSLGIVMASLAGGSARRALFAPLFVPSLWAAVVGLCVNAFDLDVPGTIEVSAANLRGAAIPVMLIVLGLHLGSRPSLAPFAPLTLAVVLRLGAGPFLALGAVELLGVDGVARNTLVLLGGMPTAVVTTIIATQYDARPDFATKTVIASTMVSIATATVLVSILQ